MSYPDAAESDERGHPAEGRDRLRTDLSRALEYLRPSPPPHTCACGGEARITWCTEMGLFCVACGRPPRRSTAHQEALARQDRLRWEAVLRECEAKASQPDDAPPFCAGCGEVHDDWDQRCGQCGAPLTHLARIKE